MGPAALLWGSPWGAPQEGFLAIPDGTGHLVPLAPTSKPHRPAGMFAWGASGVSAHAWCTGVSACAQVGRGWPGRRACIRGWSRASGPLRPALRSPHGGLSPPRLLLLLPTPFHPGLSAEPTVCLVMPKTDVPGSAVWRQDIRALRGPHSAEPYTGTHSAWPGPPHTSVCTLPPWALHPHACPAHVVPNAAQHAHTCAHAGVHTDSEVGTR